MKLSDQVAVITGAGSGIGRALAMSLARRGCHLALADIRRDGAAETARLLQQTGVRTSVHELDVADREAVHALPDAVLAEHGRAGLLINNAGVALGGTFEQVSESDFDWLMAINFHGVVRMTRAFLPLLRQNDEARLVNVSSLYGLVAPAGQTAYAASKFAVRGFSNALRHELEGSSVGVTVVHPGGVATSIAANARAPAGANATEIALRRERANKMLRMPPERAGEIIARGIERNKARVIVGADASFVSWMERLMPVSYWSLLKKAYPT
ncbi:SDR family NAD(P)-dependent oxidoreductase [Noviherbaspirillum galbum]|uniref:SDR family NAD(P)-dependent oxidoreductase n=1 Tax=Noviherbaspirillum galbum TaxID=2709383 RepID=A0A6B3SGM6_9BURK|nr:SDR family NAD(P)-dependent oxidoreductase [Noviherbaspirillum galbum]NEX60001.1 SDR family NAD(P)-dependent oxidoreductase [Noviherbaspirillum galbum]